MGRGPRAFPPNSVLHVLNRGNERRAIFTSPDDYEDFLYLARRAQQSVPLRVIAYALMPNHWHLVAWPTEVSELSQFLHQLTTGHAQRLRFKTRTIGLGHVYQSRFKAFAIQQDVHYITTVRYVEANPLRAGLVKRAEDWRWSSLRERLDRRRLIVDGPVSLPDIDRWLELVNVAPPPDPSPPDAGTGTLRKP